MRDSDSAGHDRRQARTERGSRDQKLLLRRDAGLLGFLLQLTAEQFVAAVVVLIRLVPVAPAASGMATATAIETESRTWATAAVANEIAIAMKAVAATVTATATARAIAANAIATRPRRCCRDSAWGVQEQRSCVPDPEALVKEEAALLRAETVALGAFALVSAAVSVAADRQKRGQERQWCWRWRRCQGWWYLYLGHRQQQRPP